MVEIRHVAFLPNDIQLIEAGFSVGYVEALDDLIHVRFHHEFIELDDEYVDVDQGSEVIGVLED